MLNGYSPQPWPAVRDEHAIVFNFLPKPHHVAAPAQPLILDDQATHAFSHYIAHDIQPSPSTSFSYSTPSQASSVTAFPLYAEPQSFSAGPVLENPPAAAPDDSKRDAKRPTGACTRCKKMKMKCEFRPNDQTCQRCKTGRFECVVEGRKPRTPSQREYLLAQIRQRDAMIATLLKAHRPVDATPLSLAATKLVIPPALRAANREVLASAEKPAPAAQRWRSALRERARKDKIPDDESDEWSSDESDDGEDPWDGDAAAAAGPDGVGAVYAHTLPESNAPLGIIARLSLEDQDEGRKKRTADTMEAEEVEEDTEWGIANRAYFRPGPSANLALRRVLNEREMPPAIIASGLITWAEAEKLFEVFYEFVNPYVSVLDPVLHTCTSVFERCPFLFTVVCAVSLRYHTPRPGLHKLAMHFAKTAAATSFIDGFKSVELVQGYFLLSLYGLPARRWEEDRSWFYGGLATRLAVDLGLNKLTGLTTKPLSERHARELRNRVRTWLICFNVDRSSSTQFGKPSGIHDEELIKRARDWYGGRYSHPYDLHLVMYAELLRIMSRFHAQIYVDGVLNKNCNFRAVTEATEAELQIWHDDITWRYENESDPNDPGSVFRTKGVPFFTNYMRLVMYSFGFQNAWKRHGVERGDMFFAKCLQAASAVVRHVIDVFVPSGYFKYAPDCYFVMSGFCSAFLLKLLRPEFAALIDQMQRARIISLVSSLVDALASPAVAIDDSHTPKLYARFLHGQLRAVAAASPGSEAPPPPALFVQTVAATTPGSHSSDASSSVPTPGPEDADAADGWAEDDAMGMALCEEEYLATMQAVASEGWLGSMLMPGFKWEQGGDLGGVGVMDIIEPGRR